LTDSFSDHGSLRHEVTSGASEFGAGIRYAVERGWFELHVSAVRLPEGKDMLSG